MSGIAVVAMPWAAPDTPSLQVGILTALAERAALPVTAHSLHLRAAELFADTGVRVVDIEDVVHHWWAVGLGEWIFAAPRAETGGVPGEPLDRYLDLLHDRGVPGAAVDAAIAMRAAAPQVLDVLADEVLATGCSVVGFTTTFSQTVPSLALAATLRTRAPAVRIVLGGAGCEGPQGPAILRCFAQVDHVLQGEAEPSFAIVCAQLLAGEAPRAPGLLTRDAPVEPPAGADLTASPAPVYDEYFARLARSPLRGGFRQPARVVVETSRGCWWGERHHCAFCGLNGSSMTYRSKPPAQVLSEIDALARRHRCVDFDVVDNILDPAYFGSVLPELAAGAGRDGLDYRFFYETKANLTPAEVRDLRDAGVLRIQPGIESLDTATLRRIDKGVTALQNIRLLLSAARYEINPTWNVIYGLPGDTAETYARMADLVPSLVHLKPPGLVRLQVHRFSPYFDRPADHGLRLIGPDPYYRHLYDVGPADLADLAYCFDYDRTDGRDSDADVAPLRAAVDEWHRTWTPGRQRSLRYERGPGYVRILDRRPGLAATDVVLDDVEAQLYLACQAGATARVAARHVAAAHGIELDVGEVRDLLTELCRHRLMFQEGDRFLALALPMTPDADPPPVLGPRWALELAAATAP